MAMDENKTWAAAAEVLLPQKRKLPRKFRLVEIDEDELKDVFQFLGLGLEPAEEEKLVDDDCEAMQELEERLLNRFRLTDMEEQQKNLFVGFRVIESFPSPSLDLLKTLDKARARQA